MHLDERPQSWAFSMEVTSSRNLIVEIQQQTQKAA